MEYFLSWSKKQGWMLWMEEPTWWDDNYEWVGHSYCGALPRPQWPFLEKTPILWRLHSGRVSVGPARVAGMDTLGSGVDSCCR
jgi:hypothetical protein